MNRPLNEPNGASDFIEQLHARAALVGAHIGFPEAEETRTAAAIELLARKSLVVPIKMSDVEGGLTRALRALAAGELDGVVAGVVHSTAEVIRTGLRELGLADGVETVSASFFMAQVFGDQPVLTFTDPAVVPEPTAAQLADSALAACKARVVIVGDEPRVAFLSYSTHGSADGARVKLVRDAVRRFRKRCPNILADGELQADAALVPSVGEFKAPGSRVAGRANVLVFPDLDSGNIAYKLVERLAGARALGPILHGLRAPLNDLSRGASVSDIVDVACITALMAQGAKHEFVR